MGLWVDVRGATIAGGLSGLVTSPDVWASRVLTPRKSHVLHDIDQPVGPSRVHIYNGKVLSSSALSLPPPPNYVPVPDTARRVEMGLRVDVRGVQRG
jgi:hypothetical protein